jgi:hypothetical protein
LLPTHRTDTSPQSLRFATENDNSPQNIDKNRAVNSLDINDPASIKQSKLMEQRMQMARAEEDPNVAHYTQADVKARRSRLGSNVLARLAG